MMNKVAIYNIQFIIYNMYLKKQLNKFNKFNKFITREAKRRN
jgi:hypothetical protein